MDPQVGISPEKQTVKMIFQDFKLKTVSYGKNFAMIGAVFAAVECNIESVSSLFCYWICVDTFVIQLVNISSGFRKSEIIAHAYTLNYH